MDPVQELIGLLRRREAVISDHAWRDRDPSGHLHALKEVSEQIDAWPLTHPRFLDPKLKHFLSNASYAKALAHLESLT